MSSYAYIWEFRVKPSSIAAFRQAYGPQGGWVALFRRGEGYLGTELHEDLAQPGRFLTVDRWASRDACAHFRAAFAAEFQRIDEACESFTESEKHLGDFSYSGS